MKEDLRRKEDKDTWKKDKILSSTKKQKKEKMNQQKSPGEHHNDSRKAILSHNNCLQR
jgi:hypothetical protein